MNEKSVNMSERKPNAEASTTMSMSIASDIRAAVLSGELAPGQRIFQEQLAERYGTSRIPVREALRILERDGLVVFVPNNGAWIAEVDMAKCVEIYKIRERLEPLALSESIPRMTSETLERLEQLRSDCEAASDTETFLRLDREFHLLTYSCAQASTLLGMIERFWSTTQHYRRTYSDILGAQGQWIIHAEHRLLLSAIRQKDCEEAENLLRAHIRKTRTKLEEAFCSGAAR
jgi:DNA-binding GntR family transcriptional regulator